MIRRLQQLLCRAGWHGPEDLVTAYLEPDPAYVAVECSRCRRPRVMYGAEGLAWVQEWART